MALIETRTIQGVVRFTTQRGEYYPIPTSSPANATDLPYTLVSIAALRALAKPAAAQITRTTLGCITAGDGGGATYRWLSTSNLADNGGTVINPTGNVTAGRWLWVGDTPFLNARMFESVANAIVAAAAAGKKLYFPAGTYTLNTTVPNITTVGGFGLYGDSKSSSIINVTNGSNDYVLPLNARSDGITCHDLQFQFGGVAKGFFNQKITGPNTGGWPTIIENCWFEGFTECAIVSSANDAAHTQIRSNRFIGGSVTATGVALNGKTTKCAISWNTFVNCHYGIKLGPSGAGIQVLQNDFFSDAQRPAATSMVQCWIIADPTDNGAYQGAIFNGNKFGAENWEPQDRRILIADAGPGLFAVSQHVTTPSTGYVKNVRFLYDYTAGGAIGSLIEAPYVLSYTPNILGCHFEPISDDTTFSAGVVEFGAGVLASNPGSAQFGCQNIVRLSSSPNNLAFTPFNSVKDFVGPIYDELALLTGNNVPNKFAASTGYYRDTVTPLLSTWTVANGAAISPIAGWGGTDNAIDLTFVGANSVISAIQPAITGNIQAWLELMLGPTTSGPAIANPLKEIEISLGNAAGTSFIFQRNFEIQASTRWRQVRVPLQTRTGIDMNVYNTWRIKGRNVSVTQQQCRIANFRVYEAVEPINWDSRCLQRTVAVTPPAIAAGSYWETVVNFSNPSIIPAQNVALGDFALASYSVALPAGVTMAAKSGTAAVTVMVQNATAASITPAAGSLSVKVFKN